MAPYEAPLVNFCLVAVEGGYSLTTLQGELENLGETKNEGDW